MATPHRERGVGTEAYRGIKNARRIPANTTQEESAQPTTRTTVSLNPRYQTIDQRGRTDRVGTDAYRSISNKKNIDTARTQIQTKQSVREFSTAQKTKQDAARRARVKKLRGLKAKVAGQTAQGKMLTGAVKKVRAIQASWMLLAISGTMWTIMFIFWSLSLFGIGLAGAAVSATDWIPLVGDWLGERSSAPGMALFAFGWIMNSIIGLISLGVCVVWYTMRRVHWNTSGGFIGLAFATAFYLAPLVNILPWFGLFMVLVIFTQE